MYNSQNAKSIQTVNGLIVVSTYSGDKGKTAILKIDETNAKESVNVWVGFEDLRALATMLVDFCNENER